MLGRLETKHGAARSASGPQSDLGPVFPEATATQTVLRQIVSTFFNGSPLSAAFALLAMTESAKPAEIEKLDRLLEKVRAVQKR
jgi:predicted transcriptional regulator